MRLTLPRYSSRDYHVMLMVIFPVAILLNSILFGKLYFLSWQVFLWGTLITAVAFSIDFILCGYVAVALKRRLPLEKQVAQRLSIMIIIFLLITGLFLYGLYRGYEAIHFFGYRFYETGFVWSFIIMGIVNIFLTILHEGISRFDNWRANLRETDALKAVYRQSQLQGLKSQVNPHFLFNSLNSLSSLISDNEEEAEKFLDEMSKVYRYMLRNDDDHLVTVETELKFLQSYIYLLKARYGDGLRVSINVIEADRSKFIPPLTLQVIIENAIHQQTISKKSPLEIKIHSGLKHELIVSNNIQLKIVTEVVDHEMGLDNLIHKYRLLNDSMVLIEESDTERSIILPLLTKKEEDAV
ncbi:MAG TPA: histidine kinase [Ferruginibacter sp.]|nr:histidine kinase [Ferruginibacter sp.]